jgi:hypothetical protein
LQAFLQVLPDGFEFFGDWGIETSVSAGQREFDRTCVQRQAGQVIGGPLGLLLV